MSTEANKFLRDSLIKVGELSFLKNKKPGFFKSLVSHPSVPPILDLAGLGMLAAPAVAHKMGYKPKTHKDGEDMATTVELAGLGTLAAGVGLEMLHMAKAHR